MSGPVLFPIQCAPRNRQPGRIREEVYRAAYEVYCVLYGEQEALVDLKGRGCRGGFGICELTAFLYARAFPRSEWEARVEEAFTGMNL